MGEVVSLFNHTKREYIHGGGLGFHKPAEWQFNTIACAMVSWYLLRHRDDDVRFFGDYQDDARHTKLLDQYKDATDQVIRAMIDEGMLADHGIRWQDEDDPSLYCRDIRPRSGFFWPPTSEWPD